MKQETKETILRRLRQRIFDVDDAKAARYQKRIVKMKQRLGYDRPRPIPSLPNSLWPVR